MKTKKEKEENPEIAAATISNGADETVLSVKSDDYSEIYFNHAQCGFSAFDVYAYLSEAGHDESGKMLVRRKARITMSPLEASLLSKFLSRTVASYEKTYGKLSIPQVVEEQLAGE